MISSGLSEKLNELVYIGNRVVDFVENNYSDKSDLIDDWDKAVDKIYELLDGEFPDEVKESEIFNG